jgi:Sec-independent protein translocase protein TatA
LENSINLEPNVLLGVVAGLFLLIIIMLLVGLVKLRKMRSRYNQMINGGRSENMDQLIIEMQANTNELKTENNAQKAEIDRINKEMRKMKSHVGVQRYNAFSNEGGSDLSFSIAVLDEEQDGVVLTGIHGREQTFIYAKPVEKGQSSYSLTPEEKQIIDRVAVKRNG